MKWTNLFENVDQLRLIQGIEAKLLSRKRTETMSLFAGIAAFLLQALFELISEKNYFKLEYLENFFYFLWYLVPPTNWDKAKTYEPIVELFGVYFLIFALGLYFLLTRTRFLIKESEEPFRYTFWINKFEEVPDTPGTRFTLGNKDRFNLLDNDLMVRLNERFSKRLSLLDIKSTGSDSSKAPPDASLTAHIHIEGKFAIRELDDGEWIIHVMPSIRIGPPGSPATIANPVKYPLEMDRGKSVLSASQYNRMIERVYSSIAAEIYKQIETDVRGKLAMFPTPYLRAVALYNEAEDFSGSNTIDAYDRAVDLYRESLRYFEIAKIKGFVDLQLWFCWLWHLKVRFIHAKARVQIGFAECLIYRHIISALTGRSNNTLFEILPIIKEMLEHLDKLHRKMGGHKDSSPSSDFLSFLEFPKDSWSRCRLRWLKPPQSLFDTQRALLFDGYVVTALTYYYLGAIEKAQENLEHAKAVDPLMSEKSALYLFTAGEIEPDLDKEIVLFRQAIEIAPDFQIAQYQLANSSEMCFRRQNEISKERVNSVIQEYERVLEINPGNIAALAACGYLYWLLPDFKNAKKKFKEGLEIKAIASETFTGVLNYGLARIEAEQGRFNASYDSYMQAISSDPGIGAYSLSASRHVITTPFYDFIVPEMFQRYNTFLTTVENYCQGQSELDPEDGRLTERVNEAVRSFALNDFGNACLNYYIRYGVDNILTKARNNFKAAVDKNSQNYVARYNLYIAYDWLNNEVKDIMDCLEKVVDAIPTWQTPVIAKAGYQVGKLRVDIDKYKGQVKEKNKSADEYEKEEKQLDEKNQYLFNELNQPFPPDSNFSKILTSAESDIEKSRDKANKHIKNGTELEKTLSDQLEKQGKSGNRERTQDENTQKMISETELAEYFLLEEKKSYMKIHGSLQKNKEQLEKERKQIDQQFNRPIRNKTSGTELGSNSNRSDNHATLLIKKKDLVNKISFIDRIQKHYQCKIAVRAKVKDNLKNAIEPLKKIEDLRKSAKIIVEDILKNTNLSSLHNDLENDTTINNVLILASSNKKIQWERLNEYDVEGLRACADILANILDKTVFNSLCDLILNAYYPDNFDVALIRERTVESEKKQEERDKIKPTIKNWLLLDPIHYLFLNWHYAYFDFDQHLEAVRDAIRFEEYNDQYRQAIAIFYNAEGKKYNNNEALKRYALALEAFPTPAYCDNLISAWEKIEDTNSNEQAFVKVESSLKNVIKLRPAEQYYDEKLKALQYRKKITEHFGKQALIRSSLLTPIRLLFASDLEPCIVPDKTDELLKPFSGQIAKMRDGIRKNLGIEIPGILFQDAAWLTKGSYTIMIDEIPRKTGNLAVAPEDSESTVKVEYYTWKVARDLMLHLNTFIRTNLTEFLGHQEVMNLLENQLPDIHKQMQIKPEALSVLTVVLKNLLSEQVPIIDLPQIVSTFTELQLKDKKLSTIVETIRSLTEIRPKLPGNNDQYVFYQLSTEFEAEIDQSIDRNNPQAILAMGPLICNKALQSVREKLGSQNLAALLVRKAAIRPFVRKLIESEFPHIPVLSKHELLPGLVSKGRRAETIELK